MRTFGAKDTPSNLRQIPGFATDVPEVDFRGRILGRKTAFAGIYRI
jgi:hypothetical protein